MLEALVDVDRDSLITTDRLNQSNFGPNPENEPKEACALWRAAKWVWLGGACFCGSGCPDRAEFAAHAQGLSVCTLPSVWTALWRAEFAIEININLHFLALPARSAQIS